MTSFLVSFMFANCQQLLRQFLKSLFDNNNNDDDGDDDDIDNYDGIWQLQWQ